MYHFLRDSLVFADLGLGGVGVPRLVHHRREAVEVRPDGGLPRDARLVARLEAGQVVSQESVLNLVVREGILS